MHCDSARRNPIASEIEPQLHDAPGRSVHRLKRPLSGCLDGESLEIPARTPAIGGGSENRAILLDDDAYPDLEMSADGSSGSLRNLRHYLVQRGGRPLHLAPRGAGGGQSRVRCARPGG